MPDAVNAFATEYVYVSDRLVGDIVDQLDAASSSLQAGSVQIRPPFLAFESRSRDLGMNRYAQALRATAAVQDLTGSFAYPGDFILGHAQVSWWDLKITEHPPVRVAWVVARQEGDDGRYLLSMCGSLEHYIGYEYGDHQPAGWRPSALPGLANVLKAFNHQRGRKWRVDATPVEDQEHVTEMILEAAHVGMVLDQENDSPIGVGRMEVLARTYYGLKGRVQLRNMRTYEVEEFDGVYVGTPVWVRTPARHHASGEIAPPGYGGMTIIDIE